MLDRASILKADDLKRQVVHVPQWGGDVTVRGLTGVERDAWEAWCIAKHEEWGGNVGPNIRASLLVRTIVDDKGERLFTDEDVMALGDKSGAVLAELHAVASRLSGITASDQEELAKN